MENQFEFVAVESVEESEQQVDVYDLCVTDNHNFFANGMLVHNCGELPLSPYDCCRLISINLKSFVNDAFLDNAQFDFDKFADVVQKTQRLCDDLVDLELEKIEQIIKAKADDKDEAVLWRKFKTSCIVGRRTGLGITALADAMACLQLRYDSEEAVTMIGYIFKAFRNNAYRSSIQMAKERGAFECFEFSREKGNKYIQSLSSATQEMLQQYGRRNVSLLTCAPAGSLSILTQTSSGVEPVFRNSYMRRRKITDQEALQRVDFVDASGDKWQEYAVYHKNVEEYRNKSGSDSLPDFFVEANDIDWRKRVQIQATMQQYIDHSISSTINLPKGTKAEQVSEIFMEAWKKKCKGITVYVDGSRTGVLIETKEGGILESTKNASRIAFKRPKTLEADIYRPSIEGEEWMVLVGLIEGVPYEVFAGLSDKVEVPKKYKAGKITKRKCADNKNCYDLILGEDDDQLKIKDVVTMFDNPSEATSTRMISLSLRHGVSPLFIVEQLQKEAKDSSLFSFSKVIARTLKKYIKDGEKAASDKVCLNCGKDAVIYEGGCQICKECGYSKC